MFSLRIEQITLFEHAKADYFEPRSMQHLKDTQPRHWQIMGESAIGQAIRQDINEAALYGFNSRDTVRLFLELALLLGSRFPDDLQLPWAKLALESQARGSELDKARNLHDAAMIYLETVHGTQGEYFDAACQRLLAEPITLATGSREKFQSTVMVRLDHLWPEKYQQLGEERILSLIQQGLKASASKGIKLENGAFLQICLMFIFGQYLDHNPRYAWVQAALQGNAEDAAQRVHNVHQATLSYLQRWGEYPPGGVNLPARPSASAVQGYPYEQPLDDPAVRAALNQAWQDSQADDPAKRHIEGGYLCRDEDGRFLVERWPSGQRGGIIPLPLDHDGRYGNLDVLGEFRTQPHPNLDEQGRQWHTGFQPYDVQRLATEPYIAYSYLIGVEQIWQLASTQADAQATVVGSRAALLTA